MKVIIGCGGTGGHITPALAIADLIKERLPGSEIVFVGAKGGMEEELVTSAGYPIRTLRVMGFSRRLTTANVKAAYYALRSVSEATELLRAFSPDIVIGTGGYASYPALRAAIRLGIPCAVHESNAIPGLAVRRLSARVDRVWLNFEKAEQGLSQGASVRVVGNPVGKGYRIPKPIRLPHGTSRMLLSFGGSLGAREVNKAVLSLMEKEKAMPHLYHLHATGKREYDAMRAEFSARGLERYSNLAIVPFLDDMPCYMAAADVVICRAGAMSISELAALARPAILIPSPNVTGNHQYENARALAEAGAAVLIEERELAGDVLRETALRLIAQEGERARLSNAIRAFHNPRSNAEIFDDICCLCEKNTEKRG